MTKSVFRSILQWIVAIVVSVIILNCIVAFYSLTPGFIHRDGGAR